MTDSLARYPLDCPLAFSAPDGTVLNLRAIALNLQQNGDRWIDCRLEVVTDWATYQQIDRAAWFHLQTGLRGPQSGGEFVPDRPVRLWLGLDPRWLGQLTALGDRPAVLINYFQTGQQPRPDESETWLALEVRQDRDGVQIGFRTYWIYARASLLEEAVQAGNTVLRDAAQFFQTLTQEGIEAANQQPFQLAEETERWLAELAQLDPQRGLEQSALLQVAIAFFRADDWPYEQVDERTLRTQCQGNNGRWVCYARVREEAQQFLFYSLYPEAVPPERRAALSEFITRANYGAFIGNFELDFNDGELRYKTSIDVRGSQLEVNLVRRLVAMNVAMLDEYWPGIGRAIAGESPEVAIAAIEAKLTNEG